MPHAAVCQLAGGKCDGPPPELFSTAQAEAPHPDQEGTAMLKHPDVCNRESGNVRSREVSRWSWSQLIRDIHSPPTTKLPVPLEGLEWYEATTVVWG